MNAGGWRELRALQEERRDPRGRWKLLVGLLVPILFWIAVYLAFSVWPVAWVAVVVLGILTFFLAILARKGHFSTTPVTLTILGDGILMVLLADLGCRSDDRYWLPFVLAIIRFFSILAILHGQSPFATKG